MGLLLQVGYEQRNTVNDFVVSTVDGTAGTGLLTLSNNGGQSYKELQVTGRYQFHKHFINASYVHSRAYGDLNDFFQFFGNVAKPVIQPNGQGRLPFDAPNRFLFSGEFHAPWKLIFAPVFDLHTGFPYSVQNEFREYVGPRNTRRFPEFSSFDLQVSRPVSIPMGATQGQSPRGLRRFQPFQSIQSARCTDHRRERSLWWVLQQLVARISREIHCGVLIMRIRTAVIIFLALGSHDNLSCTGSPHSLRG